MEKKLKMDRSITELPNSILTDILSRLPAKTIFSCRCVSKSWTYLTTNDPHFANLHFSRSQSDLIVQFQDKYFASENVHSIDLELDISKGFGARVEINPNFHIPGHSCEYAVANSCRGLICLMEHCTNNPCIVWNPITDEYIMLPKHSDNRCGSSFYSVLGFSPRTNKFKVLRIFKTSYYVKDIPCAIEEAEIHVVGSNSWRGIGGKLPIELSRTSCSCYVNEAIHWYYESVMSSIFLFTFHFESEQFGEIPPPSDFEKYPHWCKYYMTIGVLGGCLSICDWGNSSRETGDVGGYDIWVMKEYGVQESWSKDFVIKRTAAMGESLHGVQHLVKCLNNGEILMLSEEDVLVCYDPLKKSIRFLKFCGNELGEQFEAIVHTPSFVSLKDVIGDTVKVLNVRSRVAQSEPLKKIKAPLLVEYERASVDQKPRRLRRASLRI